MKIALVFVFGCLTVLAVSGAPAEYTKKFDGIDLDQILMSDRLLDNYFKCLMETGRCTPDGLELRENLPDAISNECSKCSEKQKNGADKVIRFLVNNKADMWAELSKKYDPEGKYKDRYPKEGKEEAEKTA